MKLTKYLLDLIFPPKCVFCKKVLKDGTLGISESDRFVAPAGMNLDLSCSGGDDDAASREQSAAEFYFE